MNRTITEEKMQQFHRHLVCTEKSSQTIRKYLRDMRCYFMNWNELRVKMIKMQQDAFTPENREITQEEYVRLIRTAICGTRVSD